MPPPTAATSTASVEAALEDLHPRSFGWALSCCDWDREEAADVLQTAYLKVLDGRAQFAGRSKLSTWFFGVIRNTASERRRRRTTRWRLLARQTPETPESLEAPEPASDNAGLRSALKRLPNRQREVLHLVFYGDLSIAEAADVMQISLGSARVHYARGKQKLRAELLLLEEP